MGRGKLIFLPNLLHEEAHAELCLPSGIAGIVRSLQGIIGESEKEARRYIRKFLSHDEMKAMPLKVLNEHSSKQEIASLLDPIEKGETWGLVSDAGLPCIADPGSDLAALAHQKGIALETFAGPSSILMALQLSGFSGQRFAFHGYLPREMPLLEKQVADLEKRAKAEGATQIWIEAPYRSLKMLEFLKEKLHPSTRLCVAVQLTSPDQRCVSLTIAEWKRLSFSLEKEPAVFLISC